MSEDRLREGCGAKIERTMHSPLRSREPTFEGGWLVH